MDDCYLINSVDLDRRLAATETGSVCTITMMLDAEGAETDEPDDVVAVVGFYPDGKWFALSMCDYVEHTLH